MSVSRSAAHLDIDDDQDDDAPRWPKPLPGQALRALIASTAEPLMPPIAELIAIARREVVARENNYPHYLGSTRKSERELLRELNGMRAIVVLLVRMAGEA